MTSTPLRSARPEALVTTAALLTSAALLLAVVVVGLRLWLSVEGPASGLSYAGGSGGDTTVAAVAPGSPAWMLGIRPGDTYEPWDGGGAVTGAGFTLDIPDRWLPLSAAGALLALGLFIVALAARRWSPAFGAIGILMAVLVASAELQGLVAMPLLALVLLAPAAAVCLLAWDRRRSGSRLAVIALVVMSALAVIIGALSFTPEAPFDQLREVSRFGPIVLALVLMGEMIVHMLLEMNARVRAGEPMSLSMLRSTALGQRALRAAEEEQRDRSAQHVHDRVLPRLRAGLLGLETGDTLRSEQELRTLATELRAAALDDQLVILKDAGLVAALRDAIDRATVGPPGNLETTASRGRPPAEVEVAALRIAQEAIRNIEAHASADAFVVRLDVGPRRVLMDIEDDGVGMDDTPLDDPASHLGLRAMQARAREVGGTLTIGPGGDSGTLVRFRWTA